MAKKIDPMSPNASPNVLTHSGVRRVNNSPLFIVIGVLCLFVIIIVFVAVKRANPQKQTQEPPKVVHNSDSSMMAEEIVAGHKGGIIPSHIKSHEKTALALPVATLENPDEPPRPPRLRPPRLRTNEKQLEIENNELERIRKLKIEQFEAAIKGKMILSRSIKSPSRPSAENSNDETINKLMEVKHQIEQEQEGDLTATFQARLQQIRATMNGGVNPDSPMLLPTQSTEGQHPSTDRWSLNARVESPRSPYELRTGSVIPGLMISGVKSALPGQIIGQVRENVYDTATGKYLLIPMGTRLYGIYSNQILYGQETLLVAWQRMIFPDGKALDMGSMPGADSAGYAGFHDQVNNHYLRIFGSALLMSGITAGISYSQNQNQYANRFNTQPTASSVMSEALGQQLGQVTAQMIAKNLDIAPSLKIRPGYRFNIMVVKDMTFSKPYQSFDY
ncbi:TrbI/VirB10 family protein [Legionella fairfieldensis]|uniref:TrbI/VirB10 family protein n=1 Tax=Legionella fairfieldensis TaxID=45064 RepID=UPI00048B639E|nr:TrbI/VirB10 family protein [Legionella fairfieldensis]